MDILEIYPAIAIVDRNAEAMRGTSDNFIFRCAMEVEWSLELVVGQKQETSGVFKARNHRREYLAKIGRSLVFAMPAGTTFWTVIRGLCCCESVVTTYK